ncbi:MAG: HVO_0758 family zinc finger protein [Halobacteriales archaeon]|nr:HVO_0758 family zinc finger protein [Halobacteriales archaeon]
MPTIRKGVRKDDLEKDTFGRYHCTDCGTKLTRIERHGEAGQVHRCPDCGREWEQLR